MSPSDLARALDDLSSASGLDEKVTRRLASLWRNLLPRLSLPKSPKGTKDLKERAKSLLWVLEAAQGPEYIANLRTDWAFIKPRFKELISAYGTPTEDAPSELTLNGITYRDSVGMASGKLEALAKRLDALWKTLQGWRRRALKPGMTVLFAGPQEFRGTASGKYRSLDDTMLVRATPKIMNRSTGYASADYILMHELGHRYEKFFPSPVNFDRPEWFTTKYSRTEGLQGSEAFAELFALGAMDIRETWGDVLDRFEGLMGGEMVLGRILHQHAKLHTIA